MGVSPSYILQFTLADLPKTINQIGRAHWSIKAREAKKWRNSVFLITRGKTPDKPLAKARVTYTRYSSVEPDEDNLRGSFKHVQDGLIDAGIIINDTRSVLVDSKCFWAKAPPKKGYIHVAVESLD